jgi:thiol-disulfide isomerase/thioredoxin
MVAAAVSLLAPGVWSRVKLSLDEEPEHQRVGAVFEPSLGQPSPKPRLVEFFAEDCPVCRRMHPVIQQLRRDCVTHAVQILQIDISRPENAPVAQQFGITGVPVFRGFARDGTTTSAAYGERSLTELRSLAAGLLEGECAGQQGSDLSATPSVGCGVVRAETGGSAQAEAPATQAAEALECRQPAL